MFRSTMGKHNFKASKFLNKVHIAFVLINMLATSPVFCTAQHCATATNTQTVPWQQHGFLNFASNTVVTASFEASSLSPLYSPILHQQLSRRASTPWQHRSTRLVQNGVAP